MVSLLLAAVSLAPVAQALPAAPAPVTVTAQEQAELAEGEVVVRWAGAGKQSVAIVDIDAPVPTVMKAVMDLPARKADIGGIKSVDVYLDEPGRSGASWVMGIASFTVSFSILYEFDLNAGYAVYSLDPAKTNDIERSDGSYQAYAVDGHTRLVYRTLSETGGNTPEWIRKRLAFKSSREMLKGMEARAEASR